MTKLLRDFGIAALLFACASPIWAEEAARLETDDAMKRATTRVNPEYNAMAKQLRLEGQVKVDVTITEEGSVENVASVSGNPVLFQSVRDAVKRWKFSPHKVDGKASKAVATLVFTFKL